MPLTPYPDSYVEGLVPRIALVRGDWIVKVLTPSVNSFMGGSWPNGRLVGRRSSTYMEVVSHWEHHAFERCTLPSCIPLSAL